jgi:hypothetical protein
MNTLKKLAGVLATLAVLAPQVNAQDCAVMEVSNLSWSDVTVYLAYSDRRLGRVGAGNVERVQICQVAPPAFRIHPLAGQDYVIHGNGPDIQTDDELRMVLFNHAGQSYVVFWNIPDKQPRNGAQQAS